MRVLLVATAASALVAPPQRALPKTVRQFNFGDFGKSKDYAAAQEKIRSYDSTKTVETAKYGKRAIRATQLNGQNVLNPEPACAAFIAFAAFECYLSAQACALAASRFDDARRLRERFLFRFRGSAQVRASLPEIFVRYQQ